MNDKITGIKSQAAHLSAQDQLIDMRSDFEQMKRLVAAQASEIERLSARLSRDQESRAMEEVHEDYGDVWEAQGILDTRTMPARPGYVQRWVRTMQTGERGGDDAINIAKRYNQGWRPRAASTIPEGAQCPTIKFGQYGDVIGVQGMILMERPEQLHQRYANQVRETGRAQERSVKESFLRDVPRAQGVIPDISLKRHSTRGRPIEVASD